MCAPVFGRFFQPMSRDPAVAADADCVESSRCTSSARGAQHDGAPDRRSDAAADHAGCPGTLCNSCSVRCFQGSETTRVPRGSPEAPGGLGMARTDAVVVYEPRQTHRKRSGRPLQCFTSVRSRHVLVTSKPRTAVYYGQSSCRGSETRGAPPS